MTPTPDAHGPLDYCKVAGHDPNAPTPLPCEGDATKQRNEPMPPSDILNSPSVRTIVGAGGVGATVVVVIAMLIQFGVIGEGAESRRAQYEARLRSIEQTLIDQKLQLTQAQASLEMKMDTRLLSIEASLKEIKRSNDAALCRAEFELWAERMARLNPNIQLPPAPTSPPPVTSHR